MTEEQYYEMIRLSIILNGSYGVQGCKPRSDEWNKMYRKYMKLRNLYRKSREVEWLHTYFDNKE